MKELKVFRDDTPITFPDNNKEKVIKKINEILSNLLFFRELVQEDNVIVSNIWTHLGLNESYHSELSKMVGYDSVLAKEKEERYKEIRKKNDEIRGLTEQRGKEVSPEAVEGAIRRYEDIFHAWYENEGFNYASISKSSAYGITAELTSQMNFRESSRSEYNEIYKKVWTENISTEEKIENGWDIHKSQFHAELLDTENNKKRVKELLLICFPNARIYKFTGRRNDYDSFSLTTEVYISYSDLEKYYNR